MTTTGTRREFHFGARTVVLSRPDKVLFPDDGVTKADLLDYYRMAAPRMLPPLHDRPVSFIRYPDGIDGESFFQQAAPHYFPDWIRRVRVGKAGGEIEHALCQDEAALAYLAGQAAITVHSWLSRIDALDKPDRMLFDLDPPGQAVDRFGRARTAALDLRALLDELGLPAMVSTSGGRGLHVGVPLVRRQDADGVRALARAIAGVLAAREPSRYTTEVRKNQRHDRLYLDISRNAYGQHVVASYSVRARPGAPVATPLAWEELADERLEPGLFTVRTMPRRFDDTDPWRKTPAPVGSLREAWDRVEEMTRETAGG
jgi:bifunctional non-homologous end joining protein LigD